MNDAIDVKTSEKINILMITGTVAVLLYNVAYLIVLYR